MSDNIRPFVTEVECATGVASPPGNYVRRTLSQVQEIFASREAAERALESGDRVVYEVYNVKVPEAEGHLQHCSSIIQPGKVGYEYHMTKGHYHARPGTAELYIVLQGRGYLLLETLDGETAALRMQPGAMLYIPPFWAHRTVNTGEEPLIFIGVYPGDAGHDYGTIERDGFRLRVLDLGSGPVVVEQKRT